MVDGLWLEQSKELGNLVMSDRVSEVCALIFLLMTSTWTLTPFQLIGI